MPRKPEPDDEPRTFFEVERRRLDNPNEAKVGTGGTAMPRLPSMSPWSRSIDEVCGVEPGVDRTEDAVIQPSEEEQ
jgi:hypothetical protein